jgi:signal transduction histidine kinase
MVDIASSCGELLLALINNVLDVTRIQKGNLDLSMKPCDVRRGTLKVINVMKRAALSKGLAIYFNASPDLPKYVLLDQARLQQVLIALLSNAIKFTTRG